MRNKEKQVLIFLGRSRCEREGKNKIYYWRKYFKEANINLIS
jgi:hypothetical protein